MNFFDTAPADVGPNAGERLAITAAVQMYIDGFLGQEASILRQTFDQNATLITVDDGAVAPAATGAWFDRIEVKRAQGGGPLSGTHRILGIDHGETAAIAKVMLSLPTVTFTDYLALLKTKDGWRIVNKIYESKAVQQA